MGSDIKVVIFIGIDGEDGRLEDNINGWLANHINLDVIQILQSESCDAEGKASRTISIFYRE